MLARCRVPPSSSVGNTQSRTTITRWTRSWPRPTVEDVNHSPEGVGNMVDVVREFTGSIDAGVISLAVPGLLFLAWVVASGRRTRHLVEVLRAWRRPW